MRKQKIKKSKTPKAVGFGNISTLILALLLTLFFAATTIGGILAGETWYKDDTVNALEVDNSSEGDEIPNEEIEDPVEVEDPSESDPNEDVNDPEEVTEPSNEEEPEPNNPSDEEEPEPNNPSDEEEPTVENPTGNIIINLINPVINYYYNNIAEESPFKELSFLQVSSGLLLLSVIFLSYSSANISVKKKRFRKYKLGKDVGIKKGKDKKGKDKKGKDKKGGKGNRVLPVGINNQSKINKSSPQVPQTQPNNTQNGPTRRRIGGR